MNIAFIVFAGKGSRIASPLPKQFIKIKGKDLVCYAIEKFSSHPLIDEIVLITSEEYLTYTKSLVFANEYKKVSKVVVGGATRQESVRNGLNETNYSNEDHVLIHDGDRPLISSEIITNCIRKLDEGKNVIPILKHSDAYKFVSNSGRKITIDKEEYDVQTPQCFNYLTIKNAHNRLKDIAVNDDASLLEKLGEKIEYIQGDKDNYKITTNMDLEYLKGIIK